MCRILKIENSIILTSATVLVVQWGKARTVSQESVKDTKNAFSKFDIYCWLGDIK